MACAGAGERDRLEIVADASLKVAPWTDPGILDRHKAIKVGTSPSDAGLDSCGRKKNGGADGEDLSGLEEHLSEM